jgi:hypothetical protein
MTSKRTLLIHPETHDLPVEHGFQNVNGPSLIRVPEWLPDPLGRYYLYFAHHGGSYIRLAYADDLLGPYTLYDPGTLQLDQTPFTGHIASPDVHVDPVNREIVMFYHGPYRGPDGRGQFAAVATSGDGLHFEDVSGRFENVPPYLRVFEWQGTLYGTHFCWLTRSEGWFGPFEVRERPLFTGCSGGAQRQCPRHTANLVRGDELTIFYSRYGDEPERILKSTVRLGDDWELWTASAPEEVLAPVEPWEGADLPIEPSEGGAARERKHQLRDPAIYQEDGRAYLLYAVAGEYGIAITELE